MLKIIRLSTISRTRHDAEWMDSIIKKAEEFFSYGCGLNAVIKWIFIEI